MIHYSVIWLKMNAGYVIIPESLIGTTCWYPMRIIIVRTVHETRDALDKHCSNCHGNIVDDFDDGHYIPEYPVSLVTPDTRYKVINEQKAITGNSSMRFDEKGRLKNTRYLSFPQL
jgi:hypothetical protein